MQAFVKSQKVLQWIIFGGMITYFYLVVYNQTLGNKNVQKNYVSANLKFGDTTMDHENDHITKFSLDDPTIGCSLDDPYRSWTVEKCNLRQLEYFWSKELNKKDFHLEDLPRYKRKTFVESNDKCKDYEHHVVVKDVSYSLLLEITETLCGNSTKGGSSFKVWFKGRTLHNILCPVHDAFNGTYYVHCHTQYKDTGKIVIHFMFKKFQAFKMQILAPIDKLIWEKNVQLDNANDIDMTSKKCPPQANINFGEVGFWRNSSEGLRWEKDGCQLVHQNKTLQRKCLDKMSSVTLLGDSHLRFKYFYFLDLLGKLDPKKHTIKMKGNYTEGKLHFTFNSFTNSFKNVLGNVLKLGIKTSKDIFILDCGAWDIHSRHTSNYISDMIEVMKLLKEVKAHPNLKDATFIWLPMMAFPEKFVSGPRRQFHNNYIVAAINEWTSHRVRSMGYHVVDMFRFSFPRTNENVCDKHFLCYDPKKNQVFGEVGLGIVDAIMNIICNFS